MTSALTYKELRETLGVALLGLAGMLFVAMLHIDWSLIYLSQVSWGLSGQHNEIPFVGDSFVFQFGLAAFALATALGWRQATADFTGGAQLFLLHRPIGRRRIYATKIVVGLALYLACGLAPIVLYGWWASLPGTHASPFEWSMTSAAWLTWLSMTAIYLGAFLSGIRPAAWLGTRLAPLAAALMPVFMIAAMEALIVSPVAFLITPLLLVAVDTALAVSILYVVSHRDFA